MLGIPPCRGFLVCIRGWRLEQQCLDFLSTVCFHSIVLMGWKFKGSHQGSLWKKIYSLEGTLTKHLLGAYHVMKWPKFLKKSRLEIVVSTKGTPEFFNRWSILVTIGHHER